MKQHKSFIWSGKTARRTVCCFLVTLFFTNPVVFFAEPPVTTWNELKAALTHPYRAAGDTKVEVGYSLRSGVIGLNGLSSAEVQLLEFQDNAFAGISIETGSYLEGGGMIGLQTNDGGKPGNNSENEHDHRGSDR